jgi:hypothetical protein
VEVWFGKVPSDTSTREKRENEYRCHDELPWDVAKELTSHQRQLAPRWRGLVAEHHSRWRSVPASSEDLVVNWWWGRKQRNRWRWTINVTVVDQIVHRPRRPWVELILQMGLEETAVAMPFSEEAGEGATRKPRCNMDERRME